MMPMRFLGDFPENGCNINFGCILRISVQQGMVPMYGYLCMVVFMFTKFKVKMFY